ncbi:ABC transporter transmembrane domain-containing protein, partial [Campylobacter ureolyticus]|uniref:ABC transporter transmembrane domain-containing protein n=1 Tax=Campylobacter ureolyticus TaxID=827 RepID=UPI0022B3862D
MKTLSLENLTKYEAPFVLQDKNGLYFTVLKVVKKDNKSNNKSLNSKSLNDNKSNNKSPNNNNSTKKNSKNHDSYSFIVFNGGSSTNELTYDDLINISNSKFIVLSHKMLNSKIKFGFGWFYKRMLNYKRIVFEVLIASFIMQLFGLVTPLFTQVVLDKVLTHHSISTLRVIAIAFLATIVFELLLSLSRNYIFAHTTTKIDAKLGSELFSHLALLPMTYFENRKVGNIVARVRELDSIRDFIANKSVTVILDLLFSFVFVLMMLLYSVKLTLIAIFFVTIIALIYFFITPILRKRLEDKFQMGAASNSYLVEAVTGMQTVKSLAIEGSMQRE